MLLLCLSPINGREFVRPARRGNLKGRLVDFSGMDGYRMGGKNR